MLAVRPEGTYSLPRLRPHTRTPKDLSAFERHSTEALVNLAFVQARLGRPAQAIASIDRILARDPNDARAHFYRGTALAEAGRMAVAARWRNQDASLAVFEVDGIILGPGVDESEMIAHVGALAG